MTIRICLKSYIRFLLLLLFTLLSFILLAKPSFAQTSSSMSGDLQTLPASQYALNQGPHTASMAFYNFGHAMSCILIGQSPIAPCLEYKQVQDATGMVKSVPYLSSTNTSNGVLGISLSMIGEVIGNPPIRSSEFIAHFGEEIGIKSAQAQVEGSGSGVLAPIFKLWEVSRNIAYLVMILIFVGVGLMVMFRQKLNPQTVVSVQLALPGLVIGLVMITFSYFLASLISDLAFVGTNVVGYYFSLAQGSSAAPAGLVNPNTNKEENALSIFSKYTGIMSQQKIHGALSGIWDDLDDPNRGNTPIVGFLNITNMDPQKALSVFATMLAIQFILPFGGTFGGWGQFLSALPPVIIGAFDAKTLVALSLSWIAMLILIYSMFKLLLKLVSNLLTVIFLTITGPFYFLAASIPGRQNLISTWAFNMMCNVLAFPAVFAVFYFIAFILGDQRPPNTLFTISGTTAVTGTSVFPLLGGLDLNFLNSLIAFGALIALPSIPDIICKAVGKPSQLGAVAAGAIGGAIGSGQRYMGQVQGAGSGFAQAVGNVKDQPGYHLTDKGWMKVGRRSTLAQQLAAGTRPGTYTKIRTSLASVLGHRRTSRPQDNPQDLPVQEHEEEDTTNDPNADIPRG